MTAAHISVPSRVRPARIRTVEFDAAAGRLITITGGYSLNIGYRCGSGLPLDVRLQATDGTVLRVRGAGTALSVDSTAIPYAIAAVLLALGDLSGARPRCLFAWPRHHRLTAVLGLSGAPAQVRNILRISEPDPGKRPGVRVID